MSDKWIDRCMSIPEQKLSDLSEDMIKYYAYLYLKISNAVDSMGGMANFSHWINNHAKNYFNTNQLQEKELTTLKVREKKLVDFCNKFINEMPHYEDCDSESPEDELNCNCGVSFERKTYREALKDLGVE